jgi:phenylalanyl-tRNA synthetase beta subunit
MLDGGYKKIRIEHKGVEYTLLSTYGKHNKHSFIELANAVSKNIKYLRNSLSINILKNISDNLRFFKKFQIFEIGRVFTKEMNNYKPRHILDFLK